MSSVKIYECPINQIQKNYKFSSYGTFEVVKLIGEGSFSKIFLVRKLENDLTKNSINFNYYVIKIFKKFQLENNDGIITSPSKVFFTEICEGHMLQRIKKIKSPYLVQIFDWNIDRKTCQMRVLMESMPYDLRDYLAVKEHWLKMDEHLIKKIAYQLLSGLNSLHKNRIIHFDLKPENILFDPEKKIVKITDFTLSQFITYDLDKKNFGIPSAYPYTPIEGLMETKKYSFSYDIWSLGCILFELVCKMIPFKGNDLKSTIINIMSILGLNKDLMTNIDNLDDIYNHIYLTQLEKKTIINYIKSNKKINFGDDNFYDLISRMLCINPNFRISAEEAINHPCFKCIY